MTDKEFDEWLDAFAENVLNDLRYRIKLRGGKQALGLSLENVKRLIVTMILDAPEPYRYVPLITRKDG